jgi:hypothetical protein
MKIGSREWGVGSRGRKAIFIFGGGESAMTPVLKMGNG